MSTNQNPSEIVISIIVLVSTGCILRVIGILEPRGTESPDQSDRGPRKGGKRPHVPQVGGESIDSVLQVGVGEIA